MKQELVRDLDNPEWIARHQEKSRNQRLYVAGTDEGGENEPEEDLATLNENILEHIIELALVELGRADRKHGSMTGPADGMGTLSCEVEELRREVERRAECLMDGLLSGKIDHERIQQIEDCMFCEAVQVTAMGIKYIRDVCLKVAKQEAMASAAEREE